MLRSFVLLGRMTLPSRIALPPRPPRHSVRSLSVSVSASAAGKQQRPSNSYVRPIIPVPIKLIAVSKGGSKSLDEVAEEWSAKIRRYAPFAISTIKPNPKGSADPEQQKEGEAERVLKQIQPKDYVVLLDERGREVSSLDMTDVLEQAGERRAANLVFLIGGPYGHGPGVYARGDDTIRLSKLVMNHQVAQVVLLEQVYRAWTITRGEPYHHI